MADQVRGRIGARGRQGRGYGGGPALLRAEFARPFTQLGYEPHDDGRPYRPNSGGYGDPRFDYEGSSGGPYGDERDADFGYGRGERWAGRTMQRYGGGRPAYSRSPDDELDDGYDNYYGGIYPDQAAGDAQGNWGPGGYGQPRENRGFGGPGYYGGIFPDQAAGRSQGSWGPAEYGQPRGYLWRGSGMPGPHAGKGPKGYKRADERIHEEVCETLTRHGGIDAKEIEVEVEGGEVTLKGMVEDRNQKRMAEDSAEAVSGVMDVHNQLRTRFRERMAIDQRNGMLMDIPEMTEMPADRQLPTSGGSAKR